MRGWWTEICQATLMGYRPLINHREGESHPGRYCISGRRPQQVTV